MENKKFLDGANDWDSIISNTYNKANVLGTLLCTIKTGIDGPVTKISVLGLTDEDLLTVIESFNEQLETYMEKNKGEIINTLGAEAYTAMENVIDETSLYEELIFADQDTLEDYGYEDEWFQESFYEKIEELREINLNNNFIFTII